MLPQLHFLPDPFLYSLGRCSRQEHLAQLLASQTTPTHNLRQHAGGQPYHVSVGSYGVDLAMQCVNPTESEGQQLWGLHGVTLHTAASDPVNYWKGPWPEGLDVARAKVRDVVDLLAPDDEMARFSPPTMACFLVPGLDGQRWTVLCTFDGKSHHLRTFSLVRVDEWTMASTLPPWTQAPLQGAATAVGQRRDARAPSGNAGDVPAAAGLTGASAAVTCRSRAKVPKTGLWEGRLPEDHPQAGYYGQGDWRFAYRKMGDTMISLGVIPPADEDLVVWTWLRGI